MKSLLLILFLSPSLYAVVERQTFESKIESILAMPQDMAVHSINGLDRKESVRSLRNRSFNSSLPMKLRWKSFMVMVEWLESQSLPEVHRALTDKAWFMRSAGLVALQHLKHKSLKKQAMALLEDDPALMVRLKAVEVLKSYNDESIVELFWSKLYSSDSFHNNKGLWIREEMAQHLIKQPRKKDLKQWIRLLNEENPAFQKIASLALKKITSDKNPESLTAIYWRKKYNR